MPGSFREAVDPVRNGRNVSAAVAAPAVANTYITPPMGRGFDPYFEFHDLCVLQTAGHKHWTIHQSVRLNRLA